MRFSSMKLVQKIDKATPPKFGAALPSLKHLLSTLTPTPNTHSILVTHVLDTAIDYIEAINSIFPVECIVAIPYSVSQKAVNVIIEKKFKIVIPNSISETFTEAEYQTIKALKDKNTSIIVQEVGGYLSKSTRKLAEYDNFLGIVEDTNNGHWLYERNGPHTIPIISMAQSPLKAVEDSIIGDAVLFSIERVLREEFSSITQGMRSAVIGFGKIGRSTAVALKGRESVVSIYDINPVKDMSAKVEGFFPRPFHDLLAESDLIVGCTGQTSIRLVDIPFIKDGAILISASSKSVEFALNDFEKACETEKFSPLIWRFKQHNGKIFYILNSGTPINFRDGSILGTILDMIYSELFICMRELALKKVPPGLSKSQPPIQDEVAKAWLKFHSDDFTLAKDDKIWDYPNSLKYGLPEDLNTKKPKE